MKRPRYVMPADIAKALKTNELAAAYRDRPDYQQNNYIGWIARARLQATRQKRLDQMIAELRKGGIYMSVAHEPSARPAAGKTR